MEGIQMLMEGLQMSNDDNKGKSYYFPEGIIMNILSRFPAKSVLKCRIVSPSWRCLTSDPVFIDLHLKNCPSCLLVANPTDGSRLDLFALDPNPKPVETHFTVHRFPLYSGKFGEDVRLLTSHNGILVFGENLSSLKNPIFSILNPVWPECVTITFPKNFSLSMIYGVYFHPLLKEYCSLWKIHENGFYGETLRIQYKILILSSTPSLKTVSNPFGDRDYGDGKTLLINNYLYWLVFPQNDPEKDFLDFEINIRDDIMEFDIMREEYMLIPCPIPSNTDCTRGQTGLLNIGGILSFVLVLTSEVTIWSLEDRARKSWTTSKYTLNVGICPSLAPDDEDQELASPIAVVDGKLALQSEGTLFVCNLMEGTMEMYPRNEYSSSARFCSHQISLVSLKNCKSTISIDKDGEVVE